MKSLTASILVLGTLMFFALTAHADDMPAFKLVMKPGQTCPLLLGEIIGWETDKLHPQSVALNGRGTACRALRGNLYAVYVNI
jgi:hypothetical protein